MSNYNFYSLTQFILYYLLHVVSLMVGIADTRQPMVVNHLAFLRHVRLQLVEHVVE